MVMVYRSGSICRIISYSLCTRIVYLTQSTVQVVKENQILRKGARIIDKETATLADMNIFPGDKLWVIDSEIHEHRDIAGISIVIPIGILEILFL